MPLVSAKDLYSYPKVLAGSSCSGWSRYSFFAKDPLGVDDGNQNPLSQCPAPLQENSTSVLRFDVVQLTAHRICLFRLSIGSNADY